MHYSVIEFLSECLPRAQVEGKGVLEVGSYYINGSAREAIDPMKPASYLGIDQGPGPLVDMVLDASDLLKKFAPESFDVVVSTEMLEHAKDWKTPIYGMKTVLRTGGILALTTRGPGMPYHGAPDDHWRFTTSDARKIFSDMDILTLRDDHGWPGILMIAKKKPNMKIIDLALIEVAKAPPKP